MFLGLYYDSNEYTVKDIFGTEIVDGETCYYCEGDGEYLSENNVYNYLNKQVEIADKYSSDIKNLLEEWWIDPNIDNDYVLEKLGFEKTDLEEPDTRDDYEPLEYEERSGWW